MMTEQGTVWLYDGVCVLCSAAVRYVLSHERHPVIHFVALQSYEGMRLAAIHGLDPHDPETFLFVEGGVVLMKSDAVIALSRHVNGPARLLRLAAYLPRSWRDAIYDLIARHRYQIFGKYESCHVPPSETRHRFSLPETK
jgi:predicted DCC family thiol-disulfide oxidoreductase YuxK